MLVVVGLLIAVAAAGGTYLGLTEDEHAWHFVVVIGIVIAVVTIADGAYSAATQVSSGTSITAATPTTSELRPEHGDDFWPAITKIWGPELRGWLYVAVIGGSLVGGVAGLGAKRTRVERV